MNLFDFVAPDTPYTAPILLKVHLDVHYIVLSSVASPVNETKPHIKLLIVHISYIIIPIGLNFIYKLRHHRPAVSTKLIFRFLSQSFPKH
jgi:hypothetical protein